MRGSSKVQLSNCRDIISRCFKYPLAQRDKIQYSFLFLTIAAPYLVKTAETLIVLFPNMIHVTCVAHGQHRVCETIRLEYPKIASMISCVKKKFINDPSHVLKFRE